MPSCARLAALAVFLASPAASQSEVAELPPDLAASAIELREAALADDRGYRLIESLTTEVGPRLAGSEAEDRARRWAAAKMAELGFANIRIEPFEVPGWRRGVERAEVLGASAQPLAVTALGGSVGTPEDGVSGEVVRFNDLYALEAAAEGSLAGKIAFVDLELYRTQDGSGYGNTNYIRGRSPSVAARKGAVAVLIRSVGTDSHRFPHTGVTRYAEDAPKIPAAALSNPDADQLARLLQRGPVRVRLALGSEPLGSRPSGNVVGEIPGSEHPEEVVVIGGHLDSWDLGTGAVDDAAGVGITMAAAKLILDSGRQPKRSIRVVLWGAEEIGLYGARAYAQAHRDALDRHAIAAESDFGAGRIWNFETCVGAEDRPTANAVHRLLRPLGIGRGEGDARGGPDISPLRAAGVPVVTLHQDGSDYFDLHHTANDTFDKIDAGAIRQNVAAYAVFTWLAANLETDWREEGRAAPSGENAVPVCG